MPPPPLPPKASQRSFQDLLNEAVLHHMQMAMVVYRLEDPADDTSLVLEDMNPAAEALLHRSLLEDRGRRIVDLFPSTATSPRLRTYADTARGGPPVDLGEFSYGDARVAPRDLALRAFGLPGRRMGMLFEDVSDQVAARRFKDEFVAMVSHELRTPLTSIKSALGLLSGALLTDLSPQARDLLDMAVRNCDRLSGLVNDLLDLEKVEAGLLTFTPAALEAGAVLEAARRGLEGYARARGVALQVASPPHPCHFQADPDRLNQVLANLVSNAVKFSPEGAPVVLRAVLQETRVRLEVEDRGPGIPAAFQPRVFERFSQSAEGASKGGSGLGLSLAKSFVERMGGDLAFSTEVGQGTTFAATFPRAQPQEPPNPDAEVLVVEDDPDVAHLLQYLLREAGLASVVAPDADTARALLAARHFRAMTLDLVLPGEGGMALLREIRQVPATRDLPVVVVSALSGEGGLHLEGQALGVLDWLDKPVDLDRLRRTVLKALAQEPHPPRPVLHVEDDPEHRAIVASALEGTAAVVPAESLAQARDWLAGAVPSAVLLDLVLPDGNGLDLMPLLGGLRPPPPVVIFSALDPPLEVCGRVAASLVKSRHSHEELRDLLQRLIE